jgi:antitoxin component YwqK of YwqJK toxin-antitoxin module
MFVIALQTSALGQIGVSEKKLKELKKAYFIEGTRELAMSHNGQLSLIQYTKKPICYNNFSFLTEDEKQKNNYRPLVNLNTNTYSIEVVPVIYHEQSNGLRVDGIYRLFKPGATLMDTTCLWASYHFKDDLREGIAEIWSIEDNGNRDRPFMRLNFHKDKLHGISEMYAGGKLAVSAEFKNGMVEGEVLAYHNAPNHLPFNPKPRINRWVGGGILHLGQIGEFSSSDLEGNISIVREHGGTIEEYPSQYELYMKIRYITDSVQSNGEWFKVSNPAEDFYRYCNGHPIVKYIVGKDKIGMSVVDALFIDATEKVVYSLLNFKEDVLKGLSKIEEEQIKFQSTPVPCAFCGESVLRKDSKENWGGCDCFKTDGSLIEVYGTVRTHFCSLDCKIKYETDCCRRNGYRYER